MREKLLQALSLRGALSWSMAGKGGGGAGTSVRVGGRPAWPKSGTCFEPIAHHSSLWPALVHCRGVKTKEAPSSHS